MTADELLTALFNGGIVISIGATVLALGLTFTPAQLVAPLRRVGLVVVMVVLSVVVVPAIAWGIAEVFPIQDTYVDGLVLATLGAGSAGALKASQLAKGADLPLAVSLVVVLQLVNIVSVPLWAGQVVSGASLNAWNIIEVLLLLVLLPLVVGLVLHARYPEHAGEWEVGLTKIANLALVIALAAGIAVNWKTIVDLIGSWVIVASLVILVLALALGALVGWKDSATRTTTGLVTGMRWSALGLIIIGTQLGGEPDYLGPAIVFALLAFVIPLAAALELGRRASAATPAPQAG